MPENLGLALPSDQNTTDEKKDKPKYAPGGGYDVTSPNAPTPPGGYVGGLDPSLNQPLPEDNAPTPSDDGTPTPTPPGEDFNPLLDTPPKEVESPFFPPPNDAFSGDSSGTLQGPGKTPDEDLQNASTALNYLSQFLDGVRGGLNYYEKQKFQKSLNEGISKMQEGQSKMADAAFDFNNATAGWLEQSGVYTEIKNQLKQYESSITASKASMDSLSSLIFQQSSNLSSARQATEIAKAKVAYASDNSNYPRPADPTARIEVIKKQREDLRLARAEEKTASLNYASLQNDISQNTKSYNSQLDTYNTNRELAKAQERGANQARAIADRYKADADVARDRMLAGQSEYIDGSNTVKGAVREFKDVQKNVILPLAEGANGVAGVAKILDSVSRDEFYTAGADGFVTGYDALARYSGNPFVAMSSSLVGQAARIAGKAMDSSGGNIDIATDKFLSDFGQATIRLNTAIKVADNLSLASTVLSNESNPTRVYDAMQIASDQVGDAVKVVTGVAQTASAFVPGAQAFTPVIGPVGDVAGVALQGVSRMAVEAVNTAWEQGGLSAPVKEYRARPMGRGLVYRDSGGPASAGTIAIAGLAKTIEGVSRQVVAEVVQQDRNIALETSAKIHDMARTALPETIKSNPSPTVIRPPIVTGD